MTTAPRSRVPAPRAPGVPEAIGVVVVSYGSPELLERNLASCRLDGPDVRVVVVDNFSTAANRAVVEELGRRSGWHVVGMPDNRGFGAACNAGVAAARALGCRTFLFLNPDARITPAVVAELRAQSLREPMALISPRLVDSAGEVVFRAARTDLRTGRVRSRPASAGLRSADPGDWLCGACVVVHEELFTRIGGYDEGYFLYWEDVDLGFRAVAAGADVVLREDLVAVHDEGGTHGERRRGPAKSALYYRYNCRNRLLFAARNLDRRRVLRWLLTTPAISWDILLRGGRRQLLHAPGLLWAAVAGSASGAGRALAALVAPRRPRTVGTSVLVVHAGADLYGSDRVLLESVQALAADNAVVVALPVAGPLVAELEARGARVVVLRMPVLRKSVLRPAGMLRLLVDAVVGLPGAVRLLRTAGRDGVLVNTTVLPSWPLLGRLLGRRVVCHVHEAEWPGPRVLRRLLLAPLLAADRVVANSRFTARVLAEHLPPLAARTTVVVNPVPGPAVPPAARVPRPGEVRLGYVGRLSPRKGPDVAVAALAELVAGGVDARLVLVGSVFPGYEWFEEELHREVARAGLADRVEFRGFSTDVAAELAACDLVLVPSVLDESFGNAAVEAVLAARPAVVSDLPGLREATSGCRSVRSAPPGRPSAWAAAVTDLLRHWDAACADALADAARLRRRHDPRRYRTGLLRASSLGGPRTGAPVHRVPTAAPAVPSADEALPA